MSTAQTLRPGRYRHFKGKEYELLFLATHSETLALLTSGTEFQTEKARRIV